MSSYEIIKDTPFHEDKYGIRILDIPQSHSASNDMQGAPNTDDIARPTTNNNLKDKVSKNSAGSLLKKFFKK